jgi:hypothetical protein
MQYWKLISLAGLLGAAGATASPIAITNASFETVTVNAATAGCTAGGSLIVGDYIDNVSNFGQGNGCVTDQPLPGWTLTNGDGGATAIGVMPYFVTGLPDGTTAGFTQRDAVISQTLSAVLGAGTYTFSVYIGSRGDNLPLTGYTIELLAGGTVIGSSHDAVNPAAGHFLQDSVTVNASAGNPLIGQALGIELFSDGDGQAIFDLASLDYVPAATSAPEPSSILLGAPMLAAGLWLRRRRSARCGPFKGE